MAAAADDPMYWVDPSRVRLAIAPSVGGFLERVAEQIENRSGDTRLVSVVFDRLPDLEPLIDAIVGKLAEVALALWPDWYFELVPFAEISRSTFAFEDRLTKAFQGAGSLRQSPLVSWVAEARRLAAEGRLPLVAGTPRAVQAAQLAMTVGPRNLLLVLGVAGDGTTEGRLLGLSRAAEWFGRTTGARILVIVPEAISRSSKLDGINFDPLFAPRLPEPTTLTPPEGTTVGVWPVIGRPHPYSRGEQLLAKRLTEDAMLGGLFQFNVPVRTRFDNRFLVDLLWPEGRVVVEVDGYEHHSNRIAFGSDRRRDYELTVSDYLVLRLPHDEVIQDVEIAVEKIRDLVQFRRSKGGSTS